MPPISPIPSRSDRRPVQLATALLSDPIIGVVGMIVLAAAVTAIALPVFITGSNLYNVVETSLVVMILAMGMTVVLISGGIDLSVGSTMALSAGTLGQAMLAGLPLIVAFLAALVVGVTIGLLNGLMVTRLGLPDFVATLAMFGFAGGILYIWTQGVPLIGYMVPELYVVGGLRPLLGTVTVPMLIALVVALALGGMLALTRTGVHLFAVGSSSSGSLQSGLKVGRTRLLAYVISGLCAGIAGIIMAGRQTTVPADLGSGYEIQAIAAAVIGGATLSGGRGRILGAILGSVLLAGVLNIIFLAGVPSSYQDIVSGGVLIAAVIANRLGASINSRVRRRNASKLGIDELDTSSVSAATS